MAVQSIREQYEGRTCNKNLDKFNRKYTRKFRVACGPDASDDINTILGTSPLPTVGISVYPTDSGAVCISVSVSQNQKFYDITYTYDSEIPIPSQQDPDPLARPAIYSTSFQKVDRPLMEDLDNVPILNSAGQPFEQPITVPSSMLLIQVEKNYDISSKTLLDFGDLVDTINDAAWVTAYGTFPKWSCRMDAIEASQHFENDTEYWQVHYKILYDPELWFPIKILNAGYGEIDGNTGNLVNSLDSTGAQVSKPILLDLTGQRSDVASYQEFDVYDEASWSGIP